ncbi:metacaspase type II [Scenedesmus sp. NREL 46B-D3]|nr:metacaspase type II [Scenedesmus sp. NREL 46B-D3]
MARRALLCGCNYPGSSHALNGCVNDVHSMHTMLTTHFNFSPENITKLIDTDPSSEQPTGANIKRHLTELVAASQPGDVLFFHYSGHGTQVPSDHEESDAKDEALCPTDMNTITDDDLRTIFAGMADGVKLTVVADCCHSGTLLDHTEVQITGPKSGDPAAPPQLIDTFTATAGGTDSRDVACRALPVDALVAALGEKLGVTVAPNQARAAMVAAFGDDASAKLGPLIQKFDCALSAAGGAQALAAQTAPMRAEAGSTLRPAVAECSSVATAKLDELLPGVGSALGGLFGGVIGGGGSGVTTGSRGIGSVLFNLALEMLSGADVAEQLPPAGTKPSPEVCLAPGRGLLITGCQAHETSADACPSGDASKAYGALTNALTTTINQYKQAYPDQDISARTLVSQVRESLTAARFAQNPCLECDVVTADAPFVLGT